MRRISRPHSHGRLRGSIRGLCAAACLAVNAELGGWAIAQVSPPAPGAEFPDMTKGLSSAERSLLEEYRNAYAKLREFYGNAYIEATARQWGWDRRISTENPEGRSAWSGVYRSRSAKLFRFDFATLDWKTESPTGELRVYVVGPQLKFEARQSAEGDLAVVREYGTTLAVLDAAAEWNFSATPYSFGAMYLEYMIFRRDVVAKDWHVEKVAATEEDGIRLVSIHCASKEKSKAAEFRFLRDSWALKDYSNGSPSMNTEDDYQRRASIEYDTSQGDFPLLKKATYWVDFGPQRKRGQFYEVTVTRFDIGPVAESEFLPSALNLSIGQTRASWGPRIFVIAIGIALVALYFYFKRRAPA